MMDSSVVGSRTIICYRHKNEIATHICTDSKCSNNPILCMQCFVEQVNRLYHYDHEKFILPFAQGIENLCSQIKIQANGGQKIYKIITGKNQFTNILSQIQKGQAIYEELDERINKIKTQVELELDSLVKEFQKSLLIEKQEYFKQLDNYHKSFVKNVQYMRNAVNDILDFNNQVKYYGNRNNFYLKMVTQARKKSDWIVKTKKNLHHLNKNFQNPNYATEITNIFSSASVLKLDNLPMWKGQQNVVERGYELKSLIKKAINQWAYVPQMKNIEDSIQNVPSHHNVSPPHHNTLPGVSNMMKGYYL